MASIQNAKTARLKITAGKGMFPHECGVLIKGSDRCYESMIDSELVTLDKDGSPEEGATGWVEVGVVSVNCEKVLVEFPRQVVSGGRRIWVPKSELGT
jgi:hypothetical protein